ncbi:right-handed parallel beta-helix repeat-containing protein [Nocardioides sp. KC13]|uniref:Right-handed parallel beta-helix repeat-containing protein n=1 Tax=Nocardioides turkmenicus TaxID=2711220 RepID=A0A6M1R9I9_9ACTN|nr:right-handed parallel beta-helix repeat-containing protein [Nocardioides sp. KC13]NGN93057.1 right-handed parallel beta-helix repeat-containing protein [Nocardioides sp. KC13]
MQSPQEGVRLLAVPSRVLLLGISTVATVVALGSTYALTSGPAEEPAPRAERNYANLPPDDFGGPVTLTPEPSPSSSASPSASSTSSVRPSASPSPKKRPSDRANRSGDRPSGEGPRESEPLGSPPPGAGVPPKKKLRVHRGDLVVRTPGQVVDGLEVHGRISVEAPNVTIRNSRVIVPTGSETAGISNNNGNGAGMLVSNVEVHAAGAAPGVNGVVGHDFTLEGSEIHHVTDQVHITGSNVTVRDNWFHDNYHFENDPYQDGGASHDDSIQIIGGSNITIAGNRFTGAYNAGVQITQSIADVSGVTIRDNLLGGGGCTVNIAEKGRGPIRGTVIRDNRFLSDQRIDGCAIIHPSSTKVSHSGNVWDDTGQPVRPSRG